MGARGIGAFEGISGVIGKDILERFTVWLDYSDQITILQPNSSAGDPFWPARSGMQMDSDGDGALVVRLVIPGTPAAKAGIRPGDIIESVGGEDATADVIDHILSLLQVTDEKKIVIEFSRDGKKKSATLDLEPYI